MQNRISASFQRMQHMVAAVTPDNLERLEKSATFSLMEWTLLQERKSHAQACGKITYDEATTIYGACGSSPEALNAQPVAYRIVLTKLLAELLAGRF